MRALFFWVITFSLLPMLALTFAPQAQESAVYACPMHPEVQSSTQGTCPKCNMKLVQKGAGDAQKQAEAAAPASRETGSYVCPMHLDVRAEEPSKCPKCGMALIPATPPVSEDFELRLESEPRRPAPNEKVRLRFSVYNPRTGERVRQFAPLHDELFHLFVVSQDMESFQHIHPRFDPDGTFSIDTVLPRAGRYKIYSDFFPVEGTPQVLQQNISTSGHAGDLLTSRARLTPDTSFVKVEDRMKIELKIEPEKITAGRPVALKYTLADAKTGRPVTDLAPYLAAWGHTLILSDDQTEYVHSHPEELVPDAPDRAKLRGGPTVTFDALFPRPGLYRVWSQFLRGDRLTTVSFTVSASRLE
ncbi:MAG TPA: heavy metal-binding domain-containing protein [Blastocatellia bacterium]|nr:heavy metal-binding domain-containing protein [Blastocatellia bacterium]